MKFMSTEQLQEAAKVELESEDLSAISPSLLSQRSSNVKTIQTIIFGSHLYGTNIATSDRDFKRIFIPNYRDILLQRAPHVINRTTNPTALRNTEQDTDDESFALHSYLKYLMEGQTFAVDMFFAPENCIVGEIHPIWETIRANKDKFISRKISAFIGYCRAQSHKYCVKAERFGAVGEMIELLGKYPPKETVEVILPEFKKLVEKYPENCIIWVNKNPSVSVCGRQAQFTIKIDKALEIYRKVFDSYGERSKKSLIAGAVDYKALYHAVRVAHEAEELLLTGHITFPRPEAALLLKIRREELSYQAVSDLIDEGYIKVAAALEKSVLRDEPDREFAEDLIVSVYGEI